MRQSPIYIANIKEQFEVLAPMPALERQQTVSPEIDFVVHRLIPTGLSVVEALPKHAKGWFAVQMCIAVARGADFLGLSTKKSACIYYSLHDPAHRVMSRLDRLLDGADAPPGLYIGTTLRAIDNDLFSDLDQLLQSYPEIKMIIIDSLADIRGNAQKKDAQILRTIKKYADIHGIAIVLIDQISKPGEPYGTDTIQAADTLISLSDGENEDEIYLSAVGRDIQNVNLRLKFEKAVCQWSLLDMPDPDKALESHPVVCAIQALLCDNSDGWVGTLSQCIDDAAEMGHKLGVSPERLSHVLSNLDPHLAKLGICHHRFSHGTGGALHQFTYG